MASGRTTGKSVAGKNVPSSRKIPGERAVRETDSTVPVKPVKRRRGTEKPSDPAAIDRRKQFTGTDEHADDDRRR